jgi:hypothetical protein
MVNFFVVSEYILTTPSKGGGEKIPNGPLYELNRVHSIIDLGTGLTLWTKGAVSNVRDLGWDNSDVIKLILRLRGKHYIDSEWCDNGKGALAACDAYSIKIEEWNVVTQKNMLIEYYIKFAINKLGNMIMTISCHT